VRGHSEFRLQHLQSAVDVAEDIIIAEDIIVPNPNCPISKIAQHRIALTVRRAIGVLPAVDFNDDTLLAANKIREKRANRLLAHEFEAAELPIATMSPEHKFSARA
jgi:hypothetical protein